MVNTCSFIDPAKQESIDTILEMAEYKKSGRAQRLIVAGCMVERYRDEIRQAPGSGCADWHQRTLEDCGAVRRLGTGRRVRPSRISITT